jgi:hypothetical protein
VALMVGAFGRLDHLHAVLHEHNFPGLAR